MPYDMMYNLNRLIQIKYLDQTYCFHSLVLFTSDSLANIFPRLLRFATILDVLPFTMQPCETMETITTKAAGISLRMAGNKSANAHRKAVTETHGKEATATPSPPGPVESSDEALPPLPPPNRRAAAGSSRAPVSAHTTTRRNLRLLHERGEERVRRRVPTERNGCQWCGSRGHCGRQPPHTGTGPFLARPPHKRLYTTTGR